MRDVTTGKTAANEKRESCGEGRLSLAGPGPHRKRSLFLAQSSPMAFLKGSSRQIPHAALKPAVGKRTRRLSPKEYRALGKVLEAADDELWQGVVGTKLFC